MRTLNRAVNRFFLPETALVSTETLCASLWTCDDCFCGWSGKTTEPDGTNAARSGGWSFPTGGLACRGIRQAYEDGQWNN